MHILIVDDEPLIRDLLGDYLRERGHAVRMAGNGLEAWDILSEPDNDIGVVLADIKMPGLNGQQLVERIREQGLDVPVVFLSGMVNVSAMDAIDVGAYGIIHKPFTLTKVLAVLETLLRDREEHTPDD